MPTTALYHIPHPPSTSTSLLSSILTSLYSTYSPSPLPSSSSSSSSSSSATQPTLFHRLLRSPSNPQTHLQILSLPHLSPDTIVATTVSSSLQPQTSSQNARPKVCMRIPAGPGNSETFTQLVLTKMGALWQQRQVLTMVQGQVMQVGEFVVRLGELRQVGGGEHAGRGVVVEVSWDVDEGMDQEDGEGEGEMEGDGGEMGREALTAFWRGLKLDQWKGVREIIGSDRAESWLEILRLRS